MSLDLMLDHSDDDLGWHAHLTSRDGSCELTLYRLGTGSNASMLASGPSA
jgi:hypothetical protein